MRRTRAGMSNSLGPILAILAVCCVTTGSRAADIGQREQSGAPEFFDVFIASSEDIVGIENGKDRFPQFREQNVIVTKSGAVVVVCQARNKSRWSDRSGQDLVCKTSRDNGRTWSKARLVVTHGEQSVCPNAAVYERRRGRIFVLYNLFVWPFREPDKRKEMPGRECRQFVVHSDDEGETWTKPREITSTMRHPGAIAIFGSGEGIQLRRGEHRGRLVVPGGDFHEGKKLYAFLSDDLGDTWRLGQVVPNPNAYFTPCENSIAELPDGRLIMNNRSNNGFRRRAFSADGGQTWSAIENDTGLPSVSCNASIIAVADPRDPKRAILLYAGPVGPDKTKGQEGPKRMNGTACVSFDLGRTWPLRKLVVADEFAYSSLAALPDGAIGLFYETRSHKDIRLARFGLPWLLGENEE